MRRLRTSLTLGALLVGTWLVLPASAQFTIVNGVVQMAGLNVALGSAALPSITLRGGPTSGFYGVAATAPAVASGGVGVQEWTSAATYVAAGVPIGWLSGALGNSADTGWSRTGPGIVALGNGTQADTSGSVVALGFRTSGTTAMAVADVAANSCSSGTETIAGNDNVGAITIPATAGTQCRITFTVTAPVRRHCTFNDESTTIALRSTYVDQTHTDVLGAFTNGDVVTYNCNVR